jgi:NNP family nitrate/nitrite transporter-like MFS transporter
MKAKKLELLNFRTPAMRAFHMTWLAFFVCFFGWFGIAPLTPLLRDEFHLSKAQIGNAMIASVAATVFARLVIGWLCDRFGPRRVYVGLLAIGALPVLGIGLAHGYTGFLIGRLLIGAIGAAFVITQYHTSVMFAPNVVGTANATAAGWGNLGGGVAQVVMPLLVSGLLALGCTVAQSWRLAMIVPATLMLVLAVLYGKLTQDDPSGNRASSSKPSPVQAPKHNTFLIAARDPKAWALALMYGACFGVELTIHNVAALYYRDRFGVGLAAAGLIAGSFGGLALFARALGGIAGDRAGMRFGVKGRVRLLGIMLLAEGVLLAAFSQIGSLPAAVVTMIGFGLFVHMAAGATYSVVPFVNRSAVGSVAGIVGAGGNAGAVLAGLLFRSEQLSTQTGLLYLGGAVIASSAASLLFRFEESAEESSQNEARAVPNGQSPVAAE